MKKDEAIAVYKKGRVTLREFAKVLGLEMWAAHNLLRSEGVSVAQGSRAETRSALQVAINSLS